MKKSNWKTGLWISLVISLIFSLPRTVQTDTVASWNNLVSSIIYLFPFCFSSWFAHLWVGKNMQLKRKGRERFLFAFASILLISLLSIFWSQLYNVLFPSFFADNELIRLRRFRVLSVRSVIISGVYFFIIYYLNVLAAKQKGLIEIEHLKQAQLQAKLSSLKEQLSPHFMFNTLNTLTALTKEPEVKKFVDELANVYRYLLQYKEHDVASLQNELGFIHSYLYIIKTRLEKAVQVTIRTDPELLHSKIPPLTLQLLIENVIKHNIATENDPLEINIYNEGSGWLVVQNKLLPKSSVMNHTGIGLNNLIQRYQLLFGKEILIERTKTAFIVKLPIVP